MAFRMSTSTQIELCNALVGFFADPTNGVGTGELNIYTGTQPATPLTAPSGDLLVTISDIAWGYAFNAVATHSATFDVDPGTITAAGAEYAYPLQSGCVIVVSNTDDNDGTYIVDTVATDNVITCTTVISGTDGVKANTIISPPYELKSALVSPTGYSGVAIADGLAGWGRLTDSAGDGSCVIDGDVGTMGANVFTINVADITTDATITLLSAEFYMA